LQLFVGGDRFRLELLLEGGELWASAASERREDLRRENRAFRAAGGADATVATGHALRHLHGREQRVEPRKLEASSGTPITGSVVFAATAPASEPRRPRRR